MSKISDIYDQLNTVVVPTIFPNKYVLENPYFPELSNSQYLCDGVGWYISSGLNTQRFVGCHTSVSREIVFHITKQSFATDQDNALRFTTEKEILEEQKLLINEITNNPTLDEMTNKIDWVSDEGIEFIFQDQYNYLLLTSTLLIEYIEDV